MPIFDKFDDIREVALKIKAIREVEIEDFTEAETKRKKKTKDALAKNFRNDELSSDLNKISVKNLKKPYRTGLLKLIFTAVKMVLILAVLFKIDILLFIIGAVSFVRFNALAKLSNSISSAFSKLELQQSIDANNITDPEGEHLQVDLENEKENLDQELNILERESSLNSKAKSVEGETPIHKFFNNVFENIGVWLQNTITAITLDKKKLVFAKLMQLELEVAIAKQSNLPLNAKKISNMCVDIISDEDASSEMHLLALAYALRHGDKKGIARSIKMFNFCDYNLKSAINDLIEEHVFAAYAALLTCETEVDFKEKSEAFVNLNTLPILRLTEEGKIYEQYFSYVQGLLLQDLGRDTEVAQHMLSLFVALNSATKDVSLESHVRIIKSLQVKVSEEVASYVQHESFKDIVAMLPDDDAKLVRCQYNIYQHDISEVANMPANMDELLKKIKEDPEFAQLRFGKNKANNWLHVLLSTLPADRLKDKEVAQAVNILLELGVSAFERDEFNCTAYYYDLHRFLDKFELGKTKEFIGLEKQEHTILEFLSDTFDEELDLSRHTIKKRQFLFLYGPPGVGKTETARRMSLERGYEFIELDRSSDKDMWRGGQEHRLENAIKTAAASGKKTVIFIDEVDSMCRNKESDLDSSHGINAAHTIQTAIGKYAKDCDVKIIGATNDLKALPPSLVSRGGVPVSFSLPTYKSRVKILQEKMKYLCFNLDAVFTESDFFNSIAAMTSGWAPRDLDNLVESIFSYLRSPAKEFTLHELIEDQLSRMNDILHPNLKHLDISKPKMKVQTKVPNFISKELSNAINAMAESFSADDRVIQHKKKVVFTYADPKQTSETLEIIRNKTYSVSVSISPDTFNDLRFVEKAWKNEFQSLCKQHERVILCIEQIDKFLEIDLEKVQKILSSQETKNALIILSTEKASLPQMFQAMNFETIPLVKRPELASLQSFKKEYETRFAKSNKKTQTEAIPEINIVEQDVLTKEEALQARRQRFGSV